MVSLIVNTCIGDPAVANRSNPYRTGTYGDRWTDLVDSIKSAIEEFDEVIVVGQLSKEQREEIEGAKYVHVPPLRRDRSDALIYREIGARHSTGDWLVFTHDDHRPGSGLSDGLRSTSPEGALLLIPDRIHGVTGEKLNNGQADGYMGGHLLAMSREAWARVPWTSVNTAYWDVPMTRIWKKAGVEIRWVDEFRCYDMEATAEET